MFAEMRFFFSPYTLTKNDIEIDFIIKTAEAYTLIFFSLFNFAISSIFAKDQHIYIYAL